MPETLEARFEAQLEELRERLHDCLQPGPSTEALAAQGILRELIDGYQRELSALRQRRGREARGAPFPSAATPTLHV